MQKSVYISCEDTFENALNTYCLIIANDADNFNISIQKQHYSTFVDSKLTSDSSVFILNANLKEGKEKFLDKGNIMIFDEKESTYQWKRLTYVKIDNPVADITLRIKNDIKIKRISDFLKTGKFDKFILDLYLIYISTETNKIQNFLNIVTSKSSNIRSIISDSMTEGKAKFYTQLRLYKRFVYKGKNTVIAIEGTIDDIVYASVLSKLNNADVCFIIDIDSKNISSLINTSNGLSISKSILNNIHTKCLLRSDFTVKFMEFAKHLKEF